MKGKDIAECIDDALSIAAWEGDTETVSALIGVGADVHARADAPLWHAAGAGHADTMRALLDAGADKDIALIEAAENGLIEIVGEMLAGGAVIHA